MSPGDLAWRCGSLAAGVARRRHRHSLLICCYHGVCADDAPTGHWLQMPRAAFAQQMEHLARHFDCLPIDDAVAALRAGTLRGPTACVTFDDGYRNNAEIAAPVLARLGIPATVYLVTGLVGTEARLWTTEIEHACRTTRAAALDVRELGLGVVALPHDAAMRGDVARRACEALKLRPDAERRSSAARVLAELGPVGRPDDGLELMTWEDAVALEAHGVVSFGAHTLDHPILSRLSDAELDRQLRDSIAEVRRRLRRPSRTFAYPNGRRQDFDARVAAILRAAAIDAGLSTREGLNDAGEDPFALRRITLGGHVRQAEFVVRASGVPALLGRRHP